MPQTRHGFCPLHHIAYLRDFDPTCPQCVLAGHLPPDQLDYDFIATKTDSLSGTPVDAGGKAIKL